MTLKELEESMSHLPPDQLARFRKWFMEFDSSSWDEVDGWITVAQKGSHRQFKHPVKDQGGLRLLAIPGMMLLPVRSASFGKPDSRTKFMQTKYLIVIEKIPNNLSAYSPDLPGCTVVRC